MKRLLFTIICTAICAAGRPRLAAEELPQVFVNGPTVVAFFEPLSSAELARDADANEALADFQLYAAHVQTPFKNVGIKFSEIYARSFRLRLGQKSVLFRPKRSPGYYLVTIGKQPRVEYGVLTDSDLLRVASDYFGTVIK